VIKLTNNILILDKKYWVCHCKWSRSWYL